jgi:hypothetical protein
MLVSEREQKNGLEARFDGRGSVPEKITLGCKR